MDYMELAIEEAKKAKDINEVPVGAVLAKDDIVLSSSYNQKIKNNDCTCHAEINVIKKASKKLNNWHLDDCTLYVTLEPCPMCAGAIRESRIKKVIIGTKSNVEENSNLLKQILGNNTEIIYLNNKECSNILTNFFSNLRK